MKHAVRLGIVLYCIWLLLSGYYLTLLLSLGALSALLATVIAVRMEIVDHETYPVQLTWGVFSYWGWLVWQIIKSNIDVARVILSPSLPISPNVVRVKASQRTTLGLVTYANSITLTPGTVSMYLDGDIIEVHALTESGARELKDGEMDRRVSAIEGSP
jgi:multicomponent Na+:H+ antiporter subunit E